MKILIVVPLYPPKHIGGTEIFTQNLAKELSKKHKVDIITTDQEEKQLKTKNLEVHYIKKHKFPQQILFLIKKILKFSDVDIIVAHMVSPSGIAAILASKLMKKPCIIRLSDLNEEIKLKKNYQIHRKLLRFVLKHSKIISISTYMKNKLKKINPRVNTLVLPQGIELKPSKKTKQTKTLINIARLVEFKDHTTLIKAMYLIHKKYPDYKLKIIGHGPEENKLKKLTKKLYLNDSIEFLGRVPLEETLKHLKNSDIFILSSVEESFGRVLLEAMNYGLPIVSTRIGGPSDIIKDEVNGFLVDPKDYKGISNRVIKLIENKKLYDKISKNNIRDIKKYSFLNVAEQFIKVYKETIKENS